MQYTIYVCVCVCVCVCVFMYVCMYVHPALLLYKGQDTESTNVRKAYSKWGTQSFWLELCWRLFTVLMQALKSIFRY